MMYGPTYIRLLISWYRGSFSPVGWGGVEFSLGVIFTAAASAKIKNEWSSTSVPPVCLHVMDRDNFIPPFF